MIYQVLHSLPNAVAVLSQYVGGPTAPSHTTIILE